MSAFLPPYGDGQGTPWLMLGAFVVVIAATVVSVRRRTRSWVDPVAPFTFFLVLVLARDLTGGTTSGLAPLVALPILWLAMTGTRRDLRVAGVLTAAVFVAPLVAIGPPSYAVSDWRRALLWTAVATLVAPVIQRMVAQLAVQTHHARATGAELEGILRGARLSSMIATDVDGTIRSFSAGAEDMLGYRAEQLVGNQDPGLFHDPDEIAMVAQELGVASGFDVYTALAGRAEPSRIWTFVRADGERIFVRLAITELRDSDEVLYGYLGVGIDSTASVRAERALIRSEARWRVLADHLPEASIIVIDEGLQMNVIAGAGAIAEGLRGYDGRSLRDFSNPSNLEILTPVIDAAFLGMEGRVELSATATGAEHEVVVTPLPDDEDGRNVLILARNVSKERVRERMVLQAKERAERLFADAPHGLAVLSVSGVVIQANEAMRSMVGEIVGGLEGRPLGLMSGPGDEKLDRYLAETLAGAGARVETSWTMCAPDGRDMHVLLSGRVLSGEGIDDVVLVNVVDVSERHRYEQRLAHLADHDVLTGLANRRRFDEELHRHLERCKRYGSTGALLLLDLDHFKEVNDTLGHGAGDQLIISTAAIVKGGVRSTDVVARLGGDEFAILLTDADRATATKVAQSIVDRIREHTATLDGVRRRVTASLGVVTIQTATEQAADILALADMTMYDAKDAGRNGIVVLDETVHRQPRSGARLQWKGRLERALEEDSFALHLQPILDLHTGRVQSAEVLLRLQDTDEIVLPARFLYIAERAGLMPAVDTWVIEHSVALLASLRGVAPPDFQLEVNLSGLSIGNPTIEHAILGALRRHEVDPSALILEITETAAVADVEVARQFAERMTGAGCRFALDDFGAGFGSFYYLKHLLFDYVKIDGEFVANCHRSSVDRTILQSIVGIARDLGKQTVAEFVADRAVLEVVRNAGVDLAQGYFIGEPVPFDEFVSTFLSNDATESREVVSAADRAR
ncbi:MAG: EAL domain-containing protein [Nocardioides sp.]